MGDICVNHKSLLLLGRLTPTRVLALLFVLFTVSVSAAETTKDGFTAWSKGDNQTAIRIWHTTAKAGDPLAQYNLGWIYLTGTGVAKDKEASILWFAKAANNGDEDAQQILLEIFIKKPGDLDSYKQIDKWLAEITKNPSEGLVKRLHKQAKDKEPVAQLVLGICFEGGIVVPRDEVQAMQNYLGAAAHGIPAAQTYLASLYEHATNISRDYDQAIVWYRKAAEQGYGEAQYRLALLHDAGGLLVRNPKEALRWSKEAESQGETRARLLIGKLLYEEQDYVSALDWFTKAEKDGDLWARYHIATMHYLGYGVLADAETALSWLRQMIQADMSLIAKMEEAADAGQLVAQVGLGHVLTKGEDNLRDKDKAFHYFLLAAIQGDPYAQRSIGDFYFQGISVGQDLSAATEWYKKASEQGDQGAKNGLVKIEHFKRLRIEEVKVLLSKAKQAFKERKYIKPINDSALTYCNKVLELDENNQHALDGIQTIVDRYIRIIEDAIADNKLDIAEDSLAVVIDIQPQNEAARELKKQLLVAQESTGTSGTEVSPAQDCTEPSQNMSGIEVVGSGTGFAINRTGYAITNEHVVTYKVGKETYLCDALQTYHKGDTKWAMLAQTDVKNDLAIIRTCRKFPTFAQLRSDQLEVEEGEKIVAYGYPLSSFFSEKPRITDGIVSSLSGLRNDSTRLQHTAPIQPGNSGGPLLDLMANVVGVNQSTLDDVAMLKMDGFVPQNVNFAIKARLVRDFLESNEISYKNADAAERDDLSLVKVRKIADKFTVLIFCWGRPEE